ncbi:MAG: hypothetical protein CMO40_06775 [Verrucomicrobiaceae bacterium]|nr:hypothetical protein [Verrucomicrobiaceae bacterium]
MPASTTSKLILIGGLYLSQGIPNGFFRHTVPVVFRESGISLEQIALFYPALYIPWMLKFVWSIFVEKFHSGKYGKYRSWIIPLQVLTAGVLVALSYWQLGSPVAFFVLAVALINIFSSIQDVATDGQAVQLLEKRERGLGNAVQVGTFYLGYIVGGGLLLVLMKSLGWNLLLVAMAVITILATIPVLRFGHFKAVRNSAEAPGGLLAFLRQPMILRILLLIAGFRMLEGFIRSVLPAMFKDWGMSLGEIGLLLGVFAPVSALAGALTAGLLVNRLGRLRSLLWFGALQVLSAGGYLILAQQDGPVSLTSALPAILVDHFVSGMTAVALFSLMMDWSRRTHGGTDYTCMDCVGVFAMMAGTTASYLLAASGGYAVAFATAVPLVFVSLFVVQRLYSTIMRTPQWQEPLPERS